MKRISSKQSLFLLIALLFSVCSYAQDAQSKAFHGDGPDDMLRVLPVAAVITMKLCGVESQSNWGHLAVCGGTSLLATAISTWGLKQVVTDTRPDGTDNKAFPSGHSAIAFAGARMMDREYRHVSPWIAVAGYSVATITAIDRVTRNRHHWEDVLAGAAIGIGATELGYWIGDKLITGKNKNCALMVGGNQLYFAYRF